MINEIHCGNCLDVMKKIESESIDLILTDLPYGITGCDWDSKIPFDELWKHYKRLIKPAGVVALTAVQPFTTDIIQSNREWFKYCWYWMKSNASGFQHAKNQPMRRIEEVVIFSPGSMGHASLLNEKRMTYNPQELKRLGKPQIRNGKRNTKSIITPRPSHKERIESFYTNYPDNILDFESTTENYHPTQKPLELFEYLIMTYTDQGGIVLDNCAGSGTTAVAALNTSRQFILIEQLQEFCDVAQARLDSRQLKLHVG
jgi:site-specific DNA-methyltransferase (adenine-specific)